MKKNLLLILVFIMAVLFEALLMLEENHTLCFSADEENNIMLAIKYENGREEIKPCFDESTGIAWFFIPAFVKENTIYVSGGSRLSWEEDRVYQIKYKGKEWKVGFMQSANLPAVFIDTESGSLDHISESKENREEGFIEIVESAGNLEYEGQVPEIETRGNSTFGVEKKSFSFTLEERMPLCGLEAVKKWNLLALYFEQNKIQSKIIYDMADYLGLKYTPGCTWVDLYCNGKYQGLYLLTEAIGVGKGRVEIFDLEKENENANGEGINWEELEIQQAENYSYYNIKSPSDISGGYLIEKERDRPEDDICFKTEENLWFSIKDPGNASKEEVIYIYNFVQNLENMLIKDDPEFKKYLDEDSFAKQFLIDALVLEADSMSASSFFYLDRGSTVLKSGPIWDFDRAFGLVRTDYEYPIDVLGGMNSWYSHLYQDRSFKENMVGQYEILLPYAEELLESGIDEYVQWIAASRRMDQQRWGHTGKDTTIYSEYENYIRYLKYFILKRMEYLNRQWGISCDLNTCESIYTGEMHTVVFKRTGGEILETRMVRDGECMKEVPALEDGEENGSGWYIEGSNLMYTDRIPIFENMVLVESNSDS